MAATAAFDSEMWMDVDEARSIFDRESYSSLLVQLDEHATIPLRLTATHRKRQTPAACARFQKRNITKTQTTTAKPIQFWESSSLTAMSIGAIFAAMNTMYASGRARALAKSAHCACWDFAGAAILASFNLGGAPSCAHRRGARLRVWPFLAHGR